MKNKVFGSIISALLLLGMIQFSLDFAPLVLSEPGTGRRDLWKLVNVTNNNAFPTSLDVNITVNSPSGVYVACSSNVTDYFTNSTNFSGSSPPYPTYWDWLNGTWLNGVSTEMYNWGEMAWYVSTGSLTSISYSDIQFWGPMYFDSGGAVSYTTFMGNTFMADWNLSASYNQPDIIYQANWQGNQIKMIPSLKVPANSMVNIVFDIVMTQPGSYTFNVTTTPAPGVTISPTTWTVGGASTILVPIDYPTIQAAINAASQGNTVVVHNETVYNGLYAEDLSIPATKTNLEIESDAGDSVTIKGVQNSLTSEWPLTRPNIEIDANGVKVHGFTIESPDYTLGKYSSGMVIGASSVEIYNNTFKVTPAADSDEVSQAVQTWHRNAEPGVDVSGLNIHNNSFVNLGGAAGGYEGIYVNLDAGNGTVTIQNNIFKGNICRAITTERSKTIISGNSIVTDLAPNGVLNAEGWQGINIGGPNANYNVTDVLVTGNIINGSVSGKGFQYGITLGHEDTSALTNVSVANNTIQMSNIGVWVRKSAGGITVKWNNILSNTLFGVSNANTTQLLNAAYNWWGNETGPNYALSQYPNSPGDKVSANVTFEPWLTKPYPQLAPISVVYLNPQKISLTAPALGTSFILNVVMANMTMMYGFQFALRWDSTLLNLTNPSLAPRFPVVWGIHAYSQFNFSQTGGYYSLLEAATAPAPAFNGTVIVASLLFKSIYDPVYPSNVTCNLAFENVTISDPTSKSMLRLIYNGTYSCNSAKPQLLFTSSEYNATKVPTEFDAFINVTNVVNLYAVAFNCTFNTTLLNVIYINVSTLGAPIYGAPVDNVAGNFHFYLTGISPAFNGTVTLAKIRFKVQLGFIWNTGTPIVNSTLAFTFHQLNTTSGVIDHDALNGTYVYRPVQGDLDLNGNVDIVDLVMVAGSFGTSVGNPLYSTVADLNCDGTIDILDIIYVAHNFGSST